MQCASSVCDTMCYVCQPQHYIFLQLLVFITLLLHFSLLSVSACSVAVVDRCTYSVVDILSLDIRETHGRPTSPKRWYAAHADVQLLQLPEYNLKIRLYKIIGLVFEYQRIL